LTTTVKPVFLLPSRVLAGLETPRTSTVPSAAFLIGAGSFKPPNPIHRHKQQKRVVVSAAASYDTRFIVPFRPHKATTASSTSLITGIPNNHHHHTAQQLRRLRRLNPTTHWRGFNLPLDVLDIYQGIWVVVSTQLNGAYDVFAASCDDGSSPKTRNLHVEQ
jgi:hypothetical protein